MIVSPGRYDPHELALALINSSPAFPFEETRGYLGGKGALVNNNGVSWLPLICCHPWFNAGGAILVSEQWACMQSAREILRGRM